MKGTLEVDVKLAGDTARFPRRDGNVDGTWVCPPSNGTTTEVVGAELIKSTALSLSTSAILALVTLETPHQVKSPIPASRLRPNNKIMVILRQFHTQNFHSRLFFLRRFLVAFTSNLELCFLTFFLTFSVRYDGVNLLVLLLFLELLLSSEN
jgi:hypothetical protein